MTIRKLKNINILSNGSIFINYATSSNMPTFLDKDNKSFSFNIKNPNIKSNIETFSNYKNKYLKDK